MYRKILVISWWSLEKLNPFSVKYETILYLNNEFAFVFSIYEQSVIKYHGLKTIIPSVKISFWPKIFYKFSMQGKGTYSLSIVSVSGAAKTFILILSVNICKLNYDILLCVCIPVLYKTIIITSLLY